MTKYQFSADLKVMGRWAFQPPGYWRNATYFVWVVDGDAGLEGIFTATHEAYARNLLDQNRTEELFLAGSLNCDVEASLILSEFNFPVTLSSDAQSLIIGLNGYEICRALHLAKAPNEGIARDALCLDEVLNDELKTQVVDRAMVYPKPYKQRPPEPGSEPRRD